MERMGINLYTYFISSDLEIKLLRLNKGLKVSLKGMNLVAPTR